MSHFYAILALLPLFLVELGAFVKTRKATSILALISMALGCSLLLLFIPTIKSISVLSEKNWAAPSIHQFTVASFHMYWFILVLSIVAGISMKKKYHQAKAHLNANPEIWAFVLLAILVFYGFLFSLFSGAYHYRYLFGAFLGSISVGGFIVQFLSKKETLLAYVFIIGIGVYQYGVPYIAEPFLDRAKIDKEIAVIERNIKTPVAYTHPMDMLPIYHYSAGKGRRKMHYPIDYSKGYNFYHISADISIRNLAKIKKDLNLPDLVNFSMQNKEFLVRGNKSFSYNLSEYLEKNGAIEIDIDGLKFNRVRNRQ